MENVPMEAWNADDVQLILGDACILDRLDNQTLTPDSTIFLTYWVWMEDRNELPEVPGVHRVRG
jgi:hypothetical protein